MISIVIPNYNGASLLKKNLPRVLELLEKSKMSYEVILVDDASTDNSIEELKIANSKLQIINKNLKLEIIQKTNNEGFSSTVDLGIRTAKSNIVFVIKTDSVPKNKDYFALMLQHFENAKVFAVSANLKTIEDGKIEYRGCGQIYFKKGFFLHRRVCSDQLSVNQQPTTNNQKLTTDNLFSSWPDGGAMAVNKKIYEKIGGFDHLFNPFYWEDVDLGYRAWKGGYEVHFEPKAVLVHKHEEGVIAKHYDKNYRRLISLRNQFIFIWKNGDWRTLLIYALWMPIHFLIVLKNRDWMFFKAELWAELKIIDIIRRRIELNRIMKREDWDLMARFQIQNKCGQLL